MTKPYVSIIVPAYNVEAYISECLESLCQQTLQNIEIIIINDGSEDRTGDIADYYASLDTRILVIHQENSGLSFARNTGVFCATGTYIGFVDSDDWVSAQAYEHLYLRAKAFDADIVLGTILYCYENGSRNRVGDTGNVFAQQVALDGKTCFTALHQSGLYIPMVCNNLYRNAFLKEYTLQFEGRYHEDELFTPLAMYHAKRIIDFKDDFYFYRQRATSIMHSDNTHLRSDLLVKISNTFLSFVENNMSEEAEDFYFYLIYHAMHLYRRAIHLRKQTRNGLHDICLSDCYKLHKLTIRLKEGQAKMLYANYFNILNELRPF